MSTSSSRSLLDFCLVLVLVLFQKALSPTVCVAPSSLLSLSSLLLLGDVAAPGICIATALPAIPSSASLDSQCELPGRCRCRLARLHCCYHVVTWFQPTFKMAE